ncbi:unnamed protein product, partial [Protopolystoma xenopodis]
MENGVCNPKLSDAGQYITPITPTNVRSSVSHESHGYKLWKYAFKRLRSVDLDPWNDFTLGLPEIPAIRHRYSAIKKKWLHDNIKVKLEARSFDHGAMRECFRMKKLPQSGSHIGSWSHASNYVAKRYISRTNRQTYFDDVRLQMEAKLWGEAFNRQNPPKK